MPNAEEIAWLPIGNDVQTWFYKYVFGLLCRILHMWLMSNVVKICTVDTSAALS